MAIRLDTRAAEFDGKFRAFLGAKREASADVETVVRAIIAEVAKHGDQALRDYTRKFDRFDLNIAGLRVTQDEIGAAAKACAPEALDALAFARDRIEAFHRRQLPRDDRITDSLGVELGVRWSAIDAVGLYVPGGACTSAGSN